MRRAVLAAVGLALALAPVAPASAQGGGAQLLPTGAEKFPRPAFRLTVPEVRSLTTDQVKVLENGNPVRDLEIIPAGGGSAGTFGTVLVIDASLSMRGAAIEGAIEAARELARQRTGSQQIGIVAFNRQPKVLLDLTDDQGAIDRALQTAPPLAPQTHIFDAVGTGLDALKQAGITAGTIVVLSDGADTGSAKSVAATAKRARDAGVRVFSIGLRSNSFDPSELRQLADKSADGGAFASANKVADLNAIFRQIGGQLASEYLVRYSSNASRGTEVRVAARIEGIPDLVVARYTVPGDATFVLVEDSFWTSSFGIVLTTLLCSLLFALAAGALMMRRVRGPGVRERLGAFVTPDEPLPEATAARNDVLTGFVVGGTQRSLEQTRWWGNFNETVDIAQIKVDPLLIVCGTAAATLIIAWILVALAGSPLAALPALVVVPVTARGIVQGMAAQTRRKFSDQLPDNLQGVASALRAGHGLVGALAMVVEDAQEPSRKEFQRVIADERLGVPLDESLENVQRRMRNRDIQQVALVAQVQREAGGNIAEVLDRVVATVRQRDELRRMVRALTAQGRLSRWIVTALPLAMLGILSVLSPGYVDPLFTTQAGLLLLAFGVLIVTIGSLVIKKIVTFDV